MARRTRRGRDARRASAAKITIDDVARCAGVSTATVSRTLRGLDHVRPALRRRVFEVAHELGYRPDPNASRLAAGRSNAVAFVTRNLRGSSVPALRQVHEVVGDAGFDLVVLSADASRSPIRFARRLTSVSQIADGVVLNDVPELVERLSSRVPTVAVDDDTTPGQAAGRLVVVLDASPLTPPSRPAIAVSGTREETP